MIIDKEMNGTWTFVQPQKPSRGKVYWVGLNISFNPNIVKGKRHM